MIGRRKDASDPLAALRLEVDALRERCDRLEAQAAGERDAAERARLQARAAALTAQREADELRAALAALLERVEQVRREARADAQGAGAGRSR